MSEEDFISPRTWFSTITGENESSFRLHKKSHVRSSPSAYTTPELFITNTQTGEEFSCGSFELLPLKLLRQFSISSPVSSTFEIFVCTSSSSLGRVEVSSMQSSPEFANSVFLVASNFNAVESVSESISPANRNFTTNYIFDRTQGPIASIGAPAAAICRVHFPFFSETSPAETWGQKDDKQVEILGNLKRKYPVVNGYPLLKKPERMQESDEDKYIAAVHSNVEALMRFNGRNIEVLKKEQRQRIDQVFGAALNVGQGMSGMDNGKVADNEISMLKFPLKCGYDAAYLTAMKNGRQNVVLTLLGNGVFGNSTKMVCETIVETHLKYGVKNNGSIRRVVVPLFSIGGHDALPILEKLLKKNSVPYEVKVFE